MPEPIASGEVAQCGECGYARPISTPTFTLFGYRVGFGPGGDTDMFMQRVETGEITCYHCAGDEHRNLIWSDDG